MLYRISMSQDRWDLYVKNICLSNTVDDYLDHPMFTSRLFRNGLVCGDVPAIVDGERHQHRVPGR